MSKLLVEKKNKDNTTIITLRKNTNRLTVIVLFFLVTIGLLIPFSVFLIKEITVGKSFLLTLLLFWGSSLYFARMFLWNKYGKEIYEIKPDTVTRVFDYRLFKDNKKIIRYNKIEFGYCKQDNPSEVFYKEDKVKLDENGYYNFIVITDTETITSNVAIKAEDLMKLI